MEIIFLSAIILIVGIVCILIFDKYRRLKTENEHLKIENQKAQHGNEFLSQNQSLAEAQIKNKSDNELSEIKSSYEKEISDLKISFEKQINEIKEIHRVEKETEYNRGYDFAINSSLIKVQVFPHKEVSKRGNFLSKEEIVNIGFSYQLFVNGIPCLSPHVHITDTVITKELKEENIKLVLQKIDDILSKIPNPNLIMSEGFSSFGKSLLNLGRN